MKSLVLAMSVLAVLPRADSAEAIPSGERSLTSLARGSSRVFVGTVRRLQYRPDARSGMIATHATFGSVTFLKGRPVAAPGRGEIVVRVAGGRDTDGSWVTIAGIPRFRVGERYLIFEDAEKPVFCSVTGWDQGCYRLVPRGRNGEPVVLGADGTPVVAVREGRVQRGRPALRREQQSLFGAAIPRPVGALPVSTPQFEADSPFPQTHANAAKSARGRLVVTRVTGDDVDRLATMSDPTDPSNPTDRSGLSAAMPASRFLAEVRSAIASRSGR